MDSRNEKRERANRKELNGDVKPDVRELKRTLSHKRETCTERMVSRLKWTRSFGCAKWALLSDPEMPNPSTDWSEFDAPITCQKSSN